MYFPQHKQCKQGILPLIFPDFSKGSCFVIGITGLAISSWHSVQGKHATTPEGYFVDVVAHDEELDVALLQFPRKRNYSYLPIGDSAAVEAGAPVFHYGFGMNLLVGFHGFFQGRTADRLFSSAHMMHGQSGGPLVSVDGVVIGINKGHFYCSAEKTKVVPNHTGPSVYIPINNIRSFLEQHATYTADGWVPK